MLVFRYTHDNGVISRKDEWDINKLGWFKVNKGVEVIRKPVIKSAFRAETLDCGANNMKTCKFYEGATRITIILI